MSTNTVPSESSQTRYLALVPAGLCVGLGIVLLYYSFGWEASYLNQDLAGAGFTGIDNLGAMWGANYSFGLIAMGLLAMVWLNSGAWKHTEGGY